MFLLTNSPFLISIGVIVLSAGWGLLLLKISVRWFFYRLILLFLGGMIVIFTYASSISVRFKFAFLFNSRFNWKLVIILFCLVLYLWILLFWDLRMIRPLKRAFEDLIGLCVLLIAGIIFLTLIVIVKLVEFERGPLKIN